MDTDVLNFLISNGMIDLSDVRQKMKDMERLLIRLKRLGEGRSKEEAEKK